MSITSARGPALFRLVVGLMALAVPGIGTAAGANEQPGQGQAPLQLWSVQMMQFGTGRACDAVALGQAGRPSYEIRFRRDTNRLLLIVAYDGPAIGATKFATVALDGQSVGRFDVALRKFGDRNAAVISLAPESVNFSEMEQHRMMTVAVGSEKFTMGFVPAEHMAGRMDACLAAMRR